MITLNGANADLIGVSTDIKPTDVPFNTIFFELDTGNFYYFSATLQVWSMVGGGI